MARIRTVKPEFFKDEDLSELEPLTRILFIGLWTLADREGRLEDRPRFIKAEVLPYDDCDVDKMLSDLSGHGFILRYVAEGRGCIFIPGFNNHQRITGKEADTPSKLPPPASEKQRGNIGDIPESQERKGREGNEEGNGTEVSQIPDGGKPSPSGTPPMPEELASILPTLKQVKLDKPATLFEVWKRAFPDVGIVKQILACDAWAVSKNVRRSPKGWARTLNTWLGKEQDRAPAKASPKPGEPGYVLTDVDRIIAGFRNAKGIPMDDVQWRTVMWGKQRADAQDLLDYFQGDWRSAVTCIAYTAEKCRGMEWGWKAVMARAHEVKKQEVAA